MFELVALWGKCLMMPTGSFSGQMCTWHWVKVYNPYMYVNLIIVLHKQLNWYTEHGPNILQPFSRKCANYLY